MRRQTAKTGDEQIGLKVNADRMKEGQYDIEYIPGGSITAVSSSASLESLRKES